MTAPAPPKSKTTPFLVTVAIIMVGMAVSRASKCGASDPVDLSRQQAAFAAIVASASAAAASARAADGGGAHVAEVAEGDGGGVDADARAFADEMTRAAKASAPDLVVHFDDDHFTLEWDRGALHGEYRLGRSYEEYRKLAAADRAAYVQKRAAAITGPSLPGTFADAEAKLVPVVRERISYEVARIMASPKPWSALRPESPHVAVTEDLWGVLAFETDDSFVRIESETLAKWNVDFDKVWPDALKRLEERSQQGATFMVGGVRELRFKDGNDSARVLLPSLIAKQPLAGGAVVAIPRDDLLLVAGANDEPALRALTERLRAEWDRGAQNARVLRVRAPRT